MSGDPDMLYPHLGVTLTSSFNTTKIDKIRDPNTLKEILKSKQIEKKDTTQIVGTTTQTYSENFYIRHVCQLGC